MNLEPVSLETSAQLDKRLQDLEEDQTVSVRIPEPELSGSPRCLVQIDVIVQHAHGLELGIERVGIIHRNAELEPPERSVLEVRFFLAVHVKPDVVASHAGIILGVLFISEVDVESKTVRIETDRFLNVTDVENWNSWTKSGVCHMEKSEAHWHARSNQR